MVVIIYEQKKTKNKKLKRQKKNGKQINLKLKAKAFQKIMRFDCDLPQRGRLTKVNQNELIHDLLFLHSKDISFDVCYSGKGKKSQIMNRLRMNYADGQ